MHSPPYNLTNINLINSFNNEEQPSSSIIIVNDINNWNLNENELINNNNNKTINNNKCIEHYDYYEYTEKWLLGVFALPFILCGLLANGMSILIFSNRHMRKQSVNWYLLVLGTSDFVILLGAFSVLTLPRLSEILVWWTGTAISYYITPIFYAFMTMAQTISVWMTVAMSLHRFIGVCFPYQSGRVLTTRNVKGIIGGVILTAVLFNICRFFEKVTFQVCWMEPIGVELPVLRMTELRKNEFYRKLFYEWAYTLIMFVIPFTVLIGVNSMVILAIHKSRKIHAKLNVREGNGARKQELAKEISTSIMLVSIVIAFLLCNTLAFAVNLLEKLDFQGLLYIRLVPWSNWLVLCNASINICIYCIFSERYRSLLFYYLRCFKRKNGGGDNNQNNFGFTGTTMSFL
ncbi:G_PROTEIN_RECEP_F1_2 domain-containing protein [Meloidogyne graminicola]|uniref:G_PROTEIN_RECEP_F1_2 domain-containing protein n=1 Tax=Meloidogyne graminicola TaxID=189291 RepID=A0A8S9ZB65_9BILA|nr:G_PROTEIN_RECEP_F1_2 domain-containing protein [Meloidogyne graminicola]